MWTSNDMTLSAYAAAQQFKRDCYPDFGVVWHFTGNELARVWTFAVLGINGTFTLTKSLDDSIWICNPSPSERPMP